MKRIIILSLIAICFFCLLPSGCVVEEGKPLTPPLLPPRFEDSEVPDVDLDAYLYLSQGSPILVNEDFGLPFQASVDRALGCLSPSDSNEASWARVAFSSSQEAQALHQAIPELQGLWKFCRGSDFFAVYGQDSGAQSLIGVTTQNDFILFKNAYPETWKMMNRLPTNPPGKPIGAGFVKPSSNFKNWLRETGDDETTRQIIDTLEKAKIEEMIIGLYSKKDLNLINWEELQESGLSVLLIGKSSYLGLVISQVLPRIGMTEDFIDEEKIYVATFDGSQVAIKSVGNYIYISVAPKLEEAKYLLRTALAKLDLVSLPSQPFTIPTLKWPLAGNIESRRILLGFGDDWTWTYCGGQPKKHTGIDVKASVGENVYASYDGKIVKIYDLSSMHNWGKGIIIEHSGFTTAYMHVNPVVQEGDYVNSRQEIATIANIDGENHLHFGVRASAYSDISKRGALPEKHENSDYQDGTFTGCKSDPLFPEKFVDPMKLKYETVT